MKLIFYSPTVQIVRTCTCGAAYNVGTTVREATVDDVIAWAKERGFDLVAKLEGEE